jgi:cytochrome c-type biogenesis protein CcmH/NrfG
MGVYPVKNSRSLMLWLGIFAAGFLAGVVFSAWKLDRGAGPDMHQAAQTEERNPAGDTRARITGLEKMVAAQPTNVQALTQLGNDYFDTGAFDKAVETYQKVLAIDPRNADVMTDMGTSYRKLGKTGECVAAFRKALEVDPDHSLALFNLGLVLRDDVKDNAEALKAWERFLQKAGDSPHAVMVRPWVSQLKKKLGATPAEAGKP